MRPLRVGANTSRLRADLPSGFRRTPPGANTGQLLQRPRRVRQRLLPRARGGEVPTDASRRMHEQQGDADRHAGAHRGSTTSSTHGRTWANRRLSTSLVAYATTTTAPAVSHTAARSSTGPTRGSACGALCRGAGARPTDEPPGNRECWMTLPPLHTVNPWSSGTEPRVRRLHFRKHPATDDPAQDAQGGRSSHRQRRP